jgi:hypothetical protein
MKTNPSQFSWQGATQRTDGSPYGPDDRRGYDLAIKEYGTGDEEYEVLLGVISTDNQYIAPVSDLANPIPEGHWEISVREVDNDNRVSEWATPLDVWYTDADPLPPTNFTAE